MQDARRLPCMATLLYCDRGACGPAGAGWFCCCSSAFFSESRMPPLVGGDTGVAGRPAATARPERVDDRGRLAVVARKPGQEQAGHEEADRQHRRGARQQIGGAAARHEAGAAADAEAAAFGFLQQHGRDQRRNDHQVDHDNDSLHLVPSVASPTAPASGCSSGLRGLKSARCYTIGRGIVTPAPLMPVN